MKKLIILITSVILMTSCGKTHRYTISNGEQNYGADSYTKNGDCIVFSYTCGCSDDETKSNTITMCGNYTVIENSNYTP
jgi:uncharacterized protein YxeA